MIGEYISGKKLMERWKIEQHELMHLVRNGLEPWHPVYLQKYWIADEDLKHTWIDGRGEFIFDDIAEIYPHLEDALFLLEDVEAHDLDVSVTADSTEKSPTQVGREGADKIPAENYFYHEGYSWRIGFQGEKATFMDFKYIRKIANLLDKPNKPIQALELVYALDDKIDQSGLISKKEAFDERLFVTRPYRDSDISDKKMRDFEKLLSDIKQETDPMITHELQQEYDRKIDDLKKMNPIVDEEGDDARPPKWQRRDDPQRKTAQHAVRNSLENAYSVFKKSGLKKLANHLENKIRTAGDYNFYYADSETPWDIIL